MRHEELQAQARSYASKLAAAEGEIARLRSEATRLCDAAARGEGEVGELHRALGAERQRAEALRQALEEAEHSRDTAMTAARSLEVRSVAFMDLSFGEQNSGLGFKHQTRLNIPVWLTVPTRFMTDSNLSTTTSSLSVIGWTRT